MKIIQYGTNLENQNDIKSFLKSIGTMKCRCMITFKTLWKENRWLIRGYAPNDEKLISSSYGNNSYAEIYDINLEKHITVSVDDIECLSINERCCIFIEE